MADKPLVLFCNCIYSEIIDRDKKAKILHTLRSSGINFEVVGDLCEYSAKKMSPLKKWAQAEPLTIIACYPRAVRWLFFAAGASLENKQVEFLNMRTSSAQEIISQIANENNTSQKGKQAGPQEKGDWVPWFPVIDYDRCKNCKQCMNFCLFGVYGLSENGKIEVQKPAGCKTNCPACARVCPFNAIIFPKYTEGPINGDEVSEEPNKKQNIKELVEGDNLEQIRNRGKTNEQIDGGQLARIQNLTGKLNIQTQGKSTSSPEEQNQER